MVPIFYFALHGYILIIKKTSRKNVKLNHGILLLRTVLSRQYLKFKK